MVCSCPKVNHFLCCWSIRTGSLFIGSFELILFTSMLLGMLYSFDFAITKRMRDAKSEGEAPHAALIALYIIVIVVSIIGILLSGMEVLGVLYKKPGMMIPYMVYVALKFLTVLVCGFVFPPLIVVNNPYFPVFSAAIVLTCLISAMGLCHFWLVLFTQYKRMKLTSKTQHMRLAEGKRHGGYGFVVEAEELEEDPKMV